MTDNPLLDSEEWGRDVCGKLMKRSDYGKRSSEFGWECDHIIPVAKGGRTVLSNLQPLHWKDNVSKGDDFPNWRCAVNF